MGQGRLRTGEGLAGAAGLVLLAGMFLPWYEDERTRSAWEAFGAIDLLLALTALLGVGLATATVTRRSPALPLAASVVLIALALLTLLVLVYRLLDQPGPDDTVRILAGAYLGLACVLGLAAGGWRGVSDEGTDGPAGPEIPARPAPPATASPSATEHTGDAAAS